jgi:hypothetical protein
MRESLALSPGIGQDVSAKSVADSQMRKELAGVSSHQAFASSRESAMTMRAAYSMCKTRLGAAISDFEEACTIRGRIAMTPPAGTNTIDSSDL